METARRPIEDRSPSPAGSVREDGGSAGAPTTGRAANGVHLSERLRSALALLRADPRRAIQEDTIHCLICGRQFRQLTNTHLRAHAVSAGEYKRRFGYNRGRALMCLTLARLYADRAVKTGLAGRIRRRPILEEPELRRRGGFRTISLEEVLTRREARQRNGHGAGPAARS